MTDPILWETATKSTAVGVCHSVVAEVANHHELWIVVSPAHVAVVHRVVYQVEDPSVPRVALVAREHLELCLFAVSARVVNRVESLLAERASVSAGCAPLLEALKAELVRAALNASRGLHLALANCANLVMLFWLD